MQVNKQILNVLGVRPEEKDIIIWLVGYSFALGLATAFFYTPATSLFLQYFSRQSLPQGYIAGGIVVYLVGLLLRKIQKGKDLQGQIKQMLYFLLGSTFILLLLFYTIPDLAKIFVFIFFAWIRVYLYIMFVSFWGFANRLFDVRQAKRLNSLINAGEVVSYILSFFSIPILLKITTLTTSDLLYFSLLGLVASIIIALRLFKRFGHLIKTKPKSKNKNNQTSTSKPIELSKQYYRLIYVLAIFPIIAVTFVEFIFFAQSQIVFMGQGESLSGFLAIFFGFASIIEFTVKTFLSGKLVDRFGLKFGLVALPALMFLNFFVASLMTVIASLAGLFFATIALSRLFLRAVKTSFYDPSSQMLYQPIPETERASFQNQVEGSFKSMGTIMAGVLVLLINYIPFVNLYHVSYIFFIITAIWTWYTFRTYTQYKIGLKLVLKASAVEEISNYQQMIDNTQNLENQELKCYFRLLYYSNYAEFRAISEQKNIHELYFFDAFFDILVETEDIKILYQFKHLEIFRQKAEIIAQKANFTLDFWSQAAISESPNLRQTTARYLGISNRFASNKILQSLMHDENQFVKTAAIQSAGQTQRAYFWPFMLDKLLTHNSFLPAFNAISIQTNEINSLLIEFIKKNTFHPIEYKLLFEQLKKDHSGSHNKFFRNLIFHENYQLRNLALETLARLDVKLNQREKSFIFQLVENEIKDILLILHFLKDNQAKQSAELVAALNNEWTNHIQTIFLFLSALYEAKVIDLIRDKLQTDDHSSRGFAIEILDNVISEELKVLVLPILELQDISELVSKYTYLISFRPTPISERLFNLVFSPYYSIGLGTRILALTSLKTIDNQQFNQVLLAFLSHPIYIFKQFAEIELQKINSQSTQTIIQRLGKIVQSELISQLPYEALSEIASQAVLINQNHDLEIGEYLIYIYQGEIEIENQKFTENQIIWSIIHKITKIYPAQEPEIFIIPFHLILMYIGSDQALIKEFSQKLHYFLPTNQK